MRGTQSSRRAHVKTDASTAIDRTRASLLSMMAVGSGLGGVRGLDVWLLDRSGGLCVHKTVVREKEVDEMTEPAKRFSRSSFGRPLDVSLCLVEVVKQSKYQSPCAEGQINSSLRHCGEASITCQRQNIITVLYTLTEISCLFSNGAL